MPLLQIEWAAAAFVICMLAKSSGTMRTDEKKTQWWHMGKQHTKRQAFHEASADTL